MRKLFRQPITLHAAIAIPAGVAAMALCTLEIGGACLGHPDNPGLAASTGLVALFMFSPASRSTFWKKSAPESMRNAAGVAPCRDCD